MEYRDERYVRVYTRDTATMKLIGQDGRQVLFELFRKVDRCGFLDFGEEGPVLAIAAVCDLSVDRVESGLPKLLERGTVSIRGNTLFIPNFLDAQETTQSDAQRQREARAKRRDLARHGVTKPVGGVTNRDGKKPGAEDPKRHETGQAGHETGQAGHETGRNRHSVLYRTVPNPDLDLKAGSKDLTATPRDGSNGSGSNGHHQPAPEPPSLEPGETDQHGRFRMYATWRPSETSLAAVKVQLVEDYAVPIFIGQFVGHFGESDESCTKSEWNQRWQKWVSRGWNDSSKRPKRPDDAPTEYTHKLRRVVK